MGVPSRRPTFIELGASPSWALPAVERARDSMFSLSSEEDKSDLFIYSFRVFLFVFDSSMVTTNDKQGVYRRE